MIEARGGQRAALVDTTREIQAMRGMRDVATACGVTQRDRADALVPA
jgi:hypothetical protein